MCVIIWLSDKLNTYLSFNFWKHNCNTLWIAVPVFAWIFHLLVICSLNFLCCSESIILGGLFLSNSNSSNSDSVNYPNFQFEYRRFQYSSSLNSGNNNLPASFVKPDKNLFTPIYGGCSKDSSPSSLYVILFCFCHSLYFFYNSTESFAITDKTEETLF